MLISIDESVDDIEKSAVGEVDVGLIISIVDPFGMIRVK